MHEHILYIRNSTDVYMCSLVCNDTEVGITGLMVSSEKSIKLINAEQVGR